MSSELGNAQFGNLQLGALDSSDPDNLFPSSGAIAFTGGTPILGFSSFSLAPAAGTIAITGGTPTLSFSGSISLAPASGTIALTGGLPLVFLETADNLHPDPGTITLTGGTPTIELTNPSQPGQIVITGGTPSVSFVRTVGTGNQLFINDILYCWKDSTFRITKQLSGNWSAEFDIDYFGVSTPVSGVNRPAKGDEVAMFWDSSKRFGGYVQSVSETGQKGTDASVPGRINYSTIHVKCGGYQLLTDRVILAKFFTLFLGGIPGITVHEIWREKLAPLGVTKSGLTSSAVQLGEQLFHYVTVTEALNKIKSRDPGWDWWIDDNKELHYARTEPSIGPTAPFTIRNGDRNVSEMTVTGSNVRFRNRQWVLPSADVEALRTDSHTGDGTNGNFSTDYSLNSKPIVTVDSGAGPVDQLVTDAGNWIPGWQFYYIPGGIGVFAAAAPAVGDAVAISYPNPFPVAFFAEDAASIASVGLYEAIWQSKNVFDKETAESEAAGLLAIYGANGFDTEIVFEYDSENQPLWLTPGMIVDVARTFPTVSGNFAVEQINSQEIGGTLFKHTVTMRSGPGEVGDAQALEQFRISARVPIVSPPYRLTFEVYKTLSGATNPGASPGLLPGFAEVQTAGVIASWDGQFPVDPPTGADMQMDILLNGISIFPVGPTNVAVIPAGQTTQASGIKFVTENIRVNRGDIVTLNALQTGTGAKDGVFHLNIKVTPNVAE